MQLLSTFVTASWQEVLVLEADAVANRSYSELSLAGLFEIFHHAQYKQLCKLAE